MKSAKRTIGRLLAAAVVLAIGTGVSAQVTTPKPEAFRFKGSFTSNWLPGDAARIALDDSNRIPLIIPPDDGIAPDLWVWDHWPMRTPDGQVATVDGYTVLIGLAAPKEAIDTPGQRHGIATWYYFYTNGGQWINGGPVFPQGTALGGRQWAGSTVYDPSTRIATFYYTAIGDLPESAAPPPLESGSIDCYEDIYYSGGGTRAGGECSPGEDPDVGDPATLEQQAIATTSATLVSGPGGGVSFQDFTPHEIVLLPGGDYYLTAAQAAATGLLTIFRDPWYYRDPQDEREYLLFSATSAIAPGPASGLVGLARKEAGGDWKLLPPLVAALGVNSQLERPHLVLENDRYYLFFTSHTFTFADGLTGPEGLYGMVSNAPTLRGRYVPLNESGLVLGNPPSAPLQTYSFLVLPGGGVMSFVNYFDLGDVTLSELAAQPVAFQRSRFGGTPAPLIEIELDRTTTRIASAPAITTAARR